MPTLSSLTGLWAGNILSPLQSSSINSLWGICTSPRPPGNRTAHNWIFPVGWPLEVANINSSQQGISAAVGRITGQTVWCSTGVFGICCESCQLQYGSNGLFHPLSLKRCSEVTTNYNAIAVFPRSLSLSIKSRPTYLNLKTKREKLFNILSWQLSPKPFWINLVHWSQWDCFHQLQQVWIRSRVSCAGKGWNTANSYSLMKHESQNTTAHTVSEL